MDKINFQIRYFYTNSILVFAGGTCLAKIHRLIHRMSEDINLDQ